MLGLRLAAKLIQPRIKTKVSQDEGSNFDHSSDTLTIGTDLFEDYGFMAHLENVHRCDFAREYDIRLWTILHEIGHYETDEVLDDDDEENLEDYLMVGFLQLFEDGRTYVKDDLLDMENQMYFNLPREWAATEWAIEWILLNPRKAKFFNWLAKF